ncbi:MAG: RNA-binding protein [Paracoccaceae bacterium]|nr:RNA-binding protein [Paracoccaceae bacterium]
MAAIDDIYTEPTGTVRKCIVSGTTKEKSGLVRFVVGPSESIFADILEKLPGKGIWVSCDQDALRMASEKGLFSRAARRAVKVPDTLLKDVEQMISNRVVGLLSLARKSGHSVAGYEKVKDWLSKDVAEVLVQSSDGSERGKSKLSTPRDGSFIGWLSSEELGAAFGRQTVIHCALASGGITNRVVHEAQRLKGLRVVQGEKSALKKEKTAI